MTGVRVTSSIRSLNFSLDKIYTVLYRKSYECVFCYILPTHNHPYNNFPMIPLCLKSHWEIIIFLVLYLQQQLIDKFIIQFLKA